MKKLITTMLALLIGLMPLQGASKSMRETKMPDFAVPAKMAMSDRAIVYQNSFEDYADFSTSFAPWTMIDGDGSATYTINGVTFLNQGYTGSFIVYNPSATTPAQTTAQWLPHTGSKYAACFAATTPPNNDWIVSPQIQLTSGNTLKFWAKSVTDQYGLEKFKVGISTTGTTATDFTIISGASTVDAPIDWTEFTYDLSAYNGQNVYVGIQCVSNDAFVFMLDDFSIVDSAPVVDVTAPTAAAPTGTMAAPGQPLNISVAVSDETGIASVVGKYQIAGQTTWTDFAMTANKVTGTYTGTVPAQAAPTTGKIKFVMTDTCNPAHTGESAESNLVWALPGVFGTGENFDGITVPAIPDGWLVEDANADTKTWVTAAGGNSAPNALKITYNAAAAMDDWIYTPAFTPVANTTYQVKFSYKAQSATFPERFEIKYGSAQTAASMTNVISAPIDVTLNTYTTDSLTFTPTSAAPMYIGFHGISDADMFNLFLDDIKVGLAPTDVAPPLPAAPTGTIAAIGSAMTVQTVVTDQTGIASVVGHYQINGGAWTDFTMTASSKATGTYTGTIPAQASAVTGKVKFTTTDTVTPTANSGDSQEFNISWEAAPPEPTSWIEWGSNYAIDNGVGIAAAPWWAAIDFDLGTNNNVNLVRIQTSVSSDQSPLVIPYKTVRVSQATTGTLDIAEDLGVSGTISADAETQALSTTSFNSSVNLSGYVAVVLGMPKGYINRDEAATSAHTWVNADAAAPTSMALLSSFGDFPGAWWIRLGVIGDGIEEEVEMLPGKSELSQNYPNPFNPSTSINFYNNMTGNVKLTVMNAKGETVATLINNNVVAGNHKVNFDGARFNSGVYFYKLETPTATLTKKMLLVK